MDTLIVKLGATGDVVRTTPLLSRIGGSATWLTAAKNTPLLEHLKEGLRCFCWEERAKALDRHYDSVINLEDTLDVAQFLKPIQSSELFGAYLDSDNALRYTEDSRRWFDLSLISSYGRQEADRLKLLNRRTYQELIFEGMGFEFAGETYLLPEPIETELSGDVAIAAEAGHVWPMKKWAYYNELKQHLEDQGLTVNVLPERSSLLQHLSDVRNHRCLVGGDSLPMHLALGTRTPCVTLFICTSPWEIYDYGVQKKIISPLLEKFFYKRGYDDRATSAISLMEVVTAVEQILNEPRVEPSNATTAHGRRFAAEATQQ
jgi:Glycosyltransferase family 9 (heptosyltransferase)